MESQQTLSRTYFTTVAQQMLIAIKHVASDNFVFQQQSALAHHACNTVQLLEHKTQLCYFRLCPASSGLEVSPVDYKIYYILA